MLFLKDSKDKSMRTSQAPATATRSLTILYISTVTVVIALALGGQLITQRFLKNQQDDARVINIAGRQRMLSQKISKAALALQVESAESERNQAEFNRQQQRLQELQAAVSLWSSSHNGLINGDPDLQLPGDNSAQITAMFADIDSEYQTILSAAQSILDTGLNETSQMLPSISTILANEDDFLLKMDEIVFQYDAEANAKIRQLRWIQWSILAVTLLVLLPLFVPIQMVTRKINQLILRMQQSGIQVTSSSTEIAASGRQLEAMMTEQVAATHQVTASVQEIAQTTAHLVATINQVTGLAQGTNQAASNGQRELTQMEYNMQQLSEATRSIAAKLGIISERAHSINAIVATITKVADQTNLLSLNAAIEAEKAGEYGAGFSVVAREIRRLADQTAVATLEIDATVQEMQSAVANGVMEMDKFTQEVRHRIDDIRQVSDQVVHIIEQIQALMPQFAIVSEGVTTQSQNADQIREAMEQLSDTSQQTAQALRDTNSALAHLQTAAQRLQVAETDKQPLSLSPIT